MELCHQQREVLIGLNLDGLRSEYEQQVGELLADRDKIREMVGQVEEECREGEDGARAGLEGVRAGNADLCSRIEDGIVRKRGLLGLLADRDRELGEAELDCRDL